MILAGDIGGTKTALGTYSPEAGNMALKVMATGGVYLGGGILPHILPAHKKGHFIILYLPYTCSFVKNPPAMTVLSIFSFVTSTTGVIIVGTSINPLLIILKPSTTSVTALSGSFASNIAISAAL